MIIIKFQTIIEDYLKNDSKSVYINTVNDTLKIDGFIIETEEYIVVTKSLTFFLIPIEYIVSINNHGEFIY